jgi:hypothetical protein
MLYAAAAFLTALTFALLAYAADRETGGDVAALCSQHSGDATNLIIPASVRRNWPARGPA